VATEQDRGDLDREPDEQQDTAQVTMYPGTQIPDTAEGLAEAGVEGSDVDSVDAAEDSGDEEYILIQHRTTLNHIQNLAVKKKKPISKT
jgi:hypothetical protein